MENNKKTSPLQEVAIKDYNETIDEIVSIFDGKKLSFCVSVLDEVKKRLSKKSVVKLNVS